MSSHEVEDDSGGSDVGFGKRAGDNDDDRPEGSDHDGEETENKNQDDDKDKQSKKKGKKGKKGGEEKDDDKKQPKKHGSMGPLWAAGFISSMHYDKQPGKQDFYKDKSALQHIVNMQWEPSQPDPMGLGVENKGGKRKATSMGKKRFWRLRYSKLMLPVLRDAANVIDSQASRRVWLQTLTDAGKREPNCCCFPRANCNSNTPVDDHWSKLHKMSKQQGLTSKQTKLHTFRMKKKGINHAKVKVPCPHCNERHGTMQDVVFPRFVFQQHGPKPTVAQVNKAIRQRVNQYQTEFHKKNKSRWKPWSWSRRPARVKHVWSRQWLRPKFFPGKRKQGDILLPGQRLDQREMNTVIQMRRSKLRYYKMLPIKMTSSRHKTMLCEALVTELRHLAGVPTYKRGGLLPAEQGVAGKLQSRGEKCVLILDLLVRTIGPFRPDTAQARDRQNIMKNKVLEYGIMDALMALLERKLDESSKGTDQMRAARERSFALHRISHPYIDTGFYCTTKKVEDVSDSCCIVCRLCDWKDNICVNATEQSGSCHTMKKEWLKVQIDEMVMCILRGLTISWINTDAVTGTSQSRCKSIAEYLTLFPQALSKIKYYHEADSSYAKADEKKGNKVVKLNRKHVESKCDKQSDGSFKDHTFEKGEFVELIKEDKPNMVASIKSLSALDCNGKALFTEKLPIKKITDVGARGDVKLKQSNWHWYSPLNFGYTTLTERVSKPHERPRYGAPTSSDKWRFWSNMLIGAPEEFKDAIKEKNPDLIEDVVKGYWFKGFIKPDEANFDVDNMTFAFSVLTKMIKENEHVAALFLGGWDKKVLVGNDETENPHGMYMDAFKDYFAKAEEKQDSKMMVTALGLFSALTSSIEYANATTRGIHWVGLKDIENISKKVSEERSYMEEQLMYNSAIAQLKLFTDYDSVVNDKEGLSLSEGIQMRINLLELVGFNTAKSYENGLPFVDRTNGMPAIARETFGALTSALNVPDFRKAMLAEGGVTVQVAARFVYLVEQNAASKNVRAIVMKGNREKDVVAALKFISAALLTQVGDSSVKKDWFQAISDKDSGIKDDLWVTSKEEAAAEKDQTKKPAKERVVNPSCCGGGSKDAEAAKHRSEIKAAKKLRIDRMKKNYTAGPPMAPKDIMLIRATGQIRTRQMLDSIILREDEPLNGKVHAIIAKILLWIGDADLDDARDSRPWALLPGLNVGSARRITSVDHKKKAEVTDFPSLSSWLFRNPGFIQRQYLIANQMIVMTFHEVPAPRTLSDELQFPKVSDRFILYNFVKEIKVFKGDVLNEDMPIRSEHLQFTFGAVQDPAEERLCTVTVEIRLPCQSPSGLEVTEGHIQRIKDNLQKQVIERSASRSFVWLPFKAPRPPRIRIVSLKNDSTDCDTLIISPTFDPNENHAYKPIPRKEPSPASTYTSRRDQSKAVNSIISQWRANRSAGKGSNSASQTTRASLFEQKAKDRYARSGVDPISGLRKIGLAFKDAMNSELELAPEGKVRSDAEDYGHLKSGEAWRLDPDTNKWKKKSIGVRYDPNGVDDNNQLGLRRTWQYWTAVTKTKAYTHRYEGLHERSYGNIKTHDPTVSSKLSGGDKRDTDMFDIIWRLMWDETVLDTIKEHYRPGLFMDEYHERRVQEKIKIRLEHLKASCHVSEDGNLDWLKGHIADYMNSLEISSPLFMMTVAAEIDSQDPLFERLSVDKFIQTEGAAETKFRDLETASYVEPDPSNTDDRQDCDRMATDEGWAVPPALALRFGHKIKSQSNLAMPKQIEGWIN